MNVAIIIPTYKETENIKVLIKKIFQNISVNIYNRRYSSKEIE